MTTWQKFFIRAAGFGSGFAITIIIVIAFWSYYSSLPKTPKPWNDSAIKATFSELTANTGEKLIANFQYIVENTTSYDYNLPNDSDAAFIKLPKAKGLTKDHEITWDTRTFVLT